jgi:hypothetical protein
VKIIKRNRCWALTWLLCELHVKTTRRLRSLARITEKKGRRKPERVFHPSASVCATCLENEKSQRGKKKKKKKEILPHSHKCLYLLVFLPTAEFLESCRRFFFDITDGEKERLSDGTTGSSCQA